MATSQRPQFTIDVSLTDGALEQVKRFLEQEDLAADAGLRVSVLPGGCSGFKYGLNIEEQPMEDTLHLAPRANTKGGVSLSIYYSEVKFVCFGEFRGGKTGKVNIGPRKPRQTSHSNTAYFTTRSVDRFFSVSSGLWPCRRP